MYFSENERPASSLLQSTYRDSWRLRLLSFSSFDSSLTQLTSESFNPILSFEQAPPVYITRKTDVRDVDSLSQSIVHIL